MRLEPVRQLQGFGPHLFAAAQFRGAALAEHIAEQVWPSLNR